MEFVKAMETRERMCDKWQNRCCIGCNLHPRNNGVNLTCNDFVLEHPAEAEKILEQWDKENPARTILDEFKENYPNAELDNDETPFLCPSSIGYVDSCNDMDCVKCWSQPAKDK